MTAARGGASLPQAAAPPSAKNDLKPLIVDDMDHGTQDRVSSLSAATVIYSLGGYMSRVAIVATIATTIATCILAFLSPSLAASDAEIGGLGDKMSGAFRCSTYASLFHDQKEQQRLFQIGLKAGRDYVEGLKSRDDPKSETLTFMRGVSTDFVVGQMYEAQSTHAYDEIVKYQNGLPLNQPLDATAAKTQAELSYRKSNCSLIQ